MPLRISRISLLALGLFLPFITALVFGRCWAAMPAWLVRIQSAGFLGFWFFYLLSPAVASSCLSAACSPMWVGGLTAYARVAVPWRNKQEGGHQGRLRHTVQRRPRPLCGSRGLRIDLCRHPGDSPCRSSTEMGVFLPGLPQAMNGMKLAHLTDLHIGPLTTIGWVRKCVKLANAEEPDIVCITGDLADGMPRDSVPGGGTREESALELARLQPPIGIVACTGNHDFSYDFETWPAVRKRCGIRFLRNQAMPLRYKAGQFIIAGRDDPAGNRTVPAKRMLADAAGRPAIMLDHRPGRAVENCGAGAMLQLSGHTHGGQLPGLSRFVAGANGGYVRGWYETDKGKLYVGTGTGNWAGAPLRIACPAEIAILTLRRIPN